MGNKGTRSRSERRLLVGSIIVAVFVVAAVVIAVIVHADRDNSGTALFDTTTTEPGTPTDAEADAIQQRWVKACESAVTDELKSPATARFSNEWDDGYPYARSPQAQLRKPGLVVDVEGDVDSQNDFGALVRSRWKCHVHLVDGATGPVDVLDVAQRK